jgi:HlyD family secretion protein
MALGATSIAASTSTIVSTNTSTSASSSSDTSGATSSSATATSLGATRGTTNRFSDRMTPGGSSNSSSATGATTSSVMGSTGLGSTAGNIPPSSSSANSSTPSGDFLLVLMKLAPAGARVKAGDVVAEFDRVNMLNRIDDYKDTVIQAEAAIRNKQATLAVTDEAHKQSVRVAKSDMEKARLDLQTLEVVSDIDAEKLKLAAEETEAQYKQLLREVPLLQISQTADVRGDELTRDESKIELQQSISNADRMIMKSPMDGLLVMQAIRRGMEYGQAQLGDQIYPGQPFLQIVDPSSMVMNATVNQVDAELLRIGMQATVRLDAYPGVELPAHVYAIGATPVPGRRPTFMREIPVRLKLDKMDSRMVPDLSASADVTLESAEQATIAPLEAVFQDEALAEKPAAKPFVFVRSAGRWRKREVELGLRNNISVAVRSGLSEGDVVAIDSPAQN